MILQHTSYLSREIIAQVGESTLSIDCQIEIQVDRDGHPSAIVIPDINALRQLHQEINLKLSELDNKLDDSRK
jgi:hypothetical protein